jgi:uncharacterized protein (TIGR03000 family)
MRTLAFRLMVALPVMIVLGWTGEVRAQPHTWGAAVGVGVGNGYGPHWAPAWGFYPTYYCGFYGNGLSMYGPPVPTYGPVPGVFGAGDAHYAYFGRQPLFPGWNIAYFPLGKHYPFAGDPAELVVPPAPVLDKPAPFEVEIRVPRDDARIFVDGVEAKSSGTVRAFATPELTTAQTLTYDIRAEWRADGMTTTHTKKVTGRAGEKAVVDFSK